MERSFRRVGIALALLLVLATLVIPALSYAQTTAASPSLSEQVVSEFGTDIQRNLPLQPNDGRFTYNGMSCTQITSGGSVTSTCQRGNLTATCNITFTNDGSTNVCSVKDASGKELWRAGQIIGGFSDTNTTCTGSNCQTEVGAGALGEAPKAVAGAVGGILGIIAADVIAGVAVFILWLAGLLLGLAGTLFNWTVYVTVFQFGNLIGNSAGMIAAWGVLRDIGNIALLFGFIFMGVGTILNLHDYNAKKALPALIIFAVLLNFSLLAAEAIVDTSNVFSSIMYNQAGVCDPDSGVDCSKDKNTGIAGKVVAAAGVGTVFNLDTLKNLASGEALQQALIFTGLALFVMITAIVLFAGSILLIIRAVTLTFLIVLSPIGFAGMAIPPLQKIAQDWWHKLISNAFFAPVYLLMIFVSLKLMEGVKSALDVSGGANTETLAGLFQQGGSSSISIAVTFALLIGFMIGALLVAKKMGAVGADFAIQTAQNVVTYPAAVTGRTLVGGGSAALGVLQKKLAGRVAGAYGNTKFANWQPEGFGGKLTKFAAGGVVKATGRGIDDIMNAPLDAGKAAKFGSLGSHDDLIKKREHRDHELEAGKTEAKMEDTLKTGDDARLEELLQEVGLQEFIQTKYAKKVSEDTARIAKAMSSDTFSALLKSDKVAEPVKEKMREERYKPLAQQVRSGDVSSIKKWANKDLESFIGSSGFTNLGEDEKKEFISLISDDQYESLKKSGGLTNSQQKQVQDYRKERFEGTFGAGMVDDKRRGAAPGSKVTRLQRALYSLNTDKRMKLDDEILAKSEVYTQLDPPDFDGMRRANKLLANEREDVGKHLDTQIATDGTKFNVYWNTISTQSKKQLKAFYGMKTAIKEGGESKKKDDDLPEDDGSGI